MAVVLAALGFLSFRQSGFWHDSVSLWDHALAVNPGLETGYYNRGMARLGRGDFFGEISALTGDVPTADVRAETVLRCLMLPGPQLEPFLLEHPFVMLRMLQAEARRVRDANRWR